MEEECSPPSDVEEEEELELFVSEKSGTSRCCKCLPIFDMVNVIVLFLKKVLCFLYRHSRLESLIYLKWELTQSPVIDVSDCLIPAVCVQEQASFVAAMTR